MNQRDKGYGKFLDEIGILDEAQNKWIKALQASTMNDVKVADHFERYSVKIGMSDEKRNEELKNKRLTVASPVTSKLPRNGAELSQLMGLKKKEAKTILKPLFNGLKLLKEYNSRDMEISFNYSGNAFDESLNKQGAVKNNEKFILMGKLLTCFEEVVENAIFIEKHDDVYRNTRRETPNFKQGYVLMSAFKDGKSIVPVKLLVKELSGMQNVLYVTITLNKIKRTELYGQRSISTNGYDSPRSVLTISLSEL